jgi:hypothetical protein
MGCSSELRSPISIILLIRSEVEFGNKPVDSCHLAPTGTPGLPPHLCPNGDSVAGNQTVTVAEAIQVTLPQGEYVIQVNGDTAQICNPSFEYSLALRLSDCGRSDIAPPNAPAVLGEITSSCVLLHPVTPVPAAPAPTDGVVITPPSTGSAGLRAN